MMYFVNVYKLYTVYCATLTAFNNKLPVYHLYKSFAVESYKADYISMIHIHFCDIAYTEQPIVCTKICPRSKSHM